ncbi:hypothetical protein R83H12_00943 [Fibrobacteria bacterium R8-3-H12]
MGERNYGVGAKMRLTHILILLCAAVALAKPSVKLPLAKELQGEELPWFAFDAKDGNGTYEKTINRDNLKEFAMQNKYRKVVFSFFATWCVSCRVSLKKIVGYADALKKKGVLVVLVNVAENDLENYSRKKIDAWARQNDFFRDEWLLVFDKYGISLEDFGLRKNGSDDVPLPRTLVADVNLRPLVLIGEEGDDFLRILEE